MRVDTVIDALISSGTLNVHDEHEIMGKLNSKEKNRELLRILIEKPNSLNEFITALRNTEQYELANLLQNQGAAANATVAPTSTELIRKFENLSEKAIEDSLTRSLQDIVDMLEIKEVLHFLADEGHLRRANRESIMAGSSNFEQHVKLVDHVKKGGKKRCIIFIKALLETKQLVLVHAIADKMSGFDTVYLF
uniref:CARD domain-containing protein n=1 Tax=Plectus sambesii TaxID=2011161 RepID=A0A914ULJ8_9BILA